MKKLVLSVMLAACLAGCHGRYALTSTDAVLPAGGSAPVVVRLERSEVWEVYMPVNEALLSFSIDGTPKHAAYTDRSGYAAVMIDAPAKPGQYDMTVFLQDPNGRQFQDKVPLWAMDASRESVAVDFDSLPAAGAPDAQAAEKALAGVASKMDVIYFTSRDPRKVHDQMLKAGNYPTGPVQMWETRWWRVEKQGKYDIPRVFVEQRLVGTLGQLRKALPNLKTGLCVSAAAAKAFTDAGLKCVTVGDQASKVQGVRKRASWAELGGDGL